MPEAPRIGSARRGTPMKELRGEAATDEQPTAALDTTELASLRTKAALDRTLLAWIRTAFALEGFGFTLTTYVSRWIESGAIHGVRADTPRRLGLTLLGAGALGLLGGCVEHLRASRQLGRLRDASYWSVSLVVAVVMVAVSALMFVGALFKAGPY
jgi:putative membrane protein